MIIVGVDPGKITGLAVLRLHWQAQLPRTSWSVAEVEATAVLPRLRDLLRGDRPDAIACERFIQGTGRRPMSYQGDAQHITGEVSGFAQANGIIFHRQLAGPAKKTGNDRVLRQLGCYNPTPDGHANDACRQICRIIATLRPDVFAQLIGM